MLDCEESTLRRRLYSRGVDQSRIDDNTLAVEKRMNIFKNETIPAIAHFDDEGYVRVVWKCLIFAVISLITMQLFMRNV